MTGISNIHPSKAKQQTPTVEETMSEYNDDFFEGKRPWSVIKDEVLETYMSPYLAKVKNLKRPILLVDGFAGPGVFDDGSAGSPLIICRAAAEFAKGNYRALFINKDKKYHEKLEGVLRREGLLGTATPILGDTTKIVPLLPGLLRDQTVFLYLDPFGPTGCPFDLLQPFLTRDNAYSAVPITLANCEIYDPAGQGTGADQGLAGMCAIDSDGSGNPHSVYVRNDASGFGQIYHAYHNGTSWTVTALTSQTVYTSSGDALLTPIHKPEIAIDRSTDTVYVFYPEMGVAGRRIVLLTSTAGSGVWTSSTLLDYPVQQVDGLTYDRTLWERDGILDVLVAPYWPTAPTLPLYVVRYEPE